MAGLRVLDPDPVGYKIMCKLGSGFESGSESSPILYPVNYYCTYIALQITINNYPGFF
jgi:hypothetical protein